ncbi:peptide deformylase [Natronoglycomyces albus]|uniref:Peptide deformylase n=2 Tax=Natronoglycomyces albus TaxID=2811108 RepID=A0A895XUR5_9ACTN|nr:peptide deformylase [Natronoglycomyces albus]
MYGEDVLHRPCADVEKFDSELSDLIDVMFASMYEAEGVGLAANQIGLSLRVFVYDCPNADGEHQIGHVVNPRLELPVAGAELDADYEGCLSIPGQSAVISRTAFARVYGLDKDGNEIVVEGDGQMARCLQHETDHLDGFVYIDKLPKKARKRLLEDFYAGNDEV